jgi:hypothetical protein
VWAFVLGYVLVGPLGCTTSGGASALPGSPVDVGRTVCTNVLGIDYSGAGAYNPPLMPAFVVGLAVAGVAAALAWWLLLPGRRAGAAA